MKERIEEIMREAKVTSSQFAKIIGVKQASLSHILTGRNNPSLDVIMKINQAYPGIHLEWLLYGKGEKGTVHESNLINSPENGEGQIIAPVMNELFPADDIDKKIKELNNLDDINEIENTPGKPENIPSMESVRYIERPPRKIVEVRIFYDDGTYETLTPSK